VEDNWKDWIGSETRPGLLRQENKVWQLIKILQITIEQSTRRSILSCRQQSVMRSSSITRVRKQYSHPHWITKLTFDSSASANTSAFPAPSVMDSIHQSPRGRFCTRLGPTSLRLSEADLQRRRRWHEKRKMIMPQYNLALSSAQVDGQIMPPASV